jgi:putative ABC transport system ATP-binding protein
MTSKDKVLIKAKNLTKSYGAGSETVTALRSASLTLSAGEFVAVTGPSGSGKSSLMNLMGLLDRPSSGRLTFFGRDVSRLDIGNLAKLRNSRVGFVFQAYHLMPSRDALGNVELPLIYRGIRRKERLRRAAVALDTVGLASRKSFFPAQLSGGEQQRVAIARALVTGPRIIVADEPTGALDSKTGDQVLTLLQQICAEGRTVLLVTHDLAVSARATRIVRMRDGRIIGDEDMTGKSTPPFAPTAESPEMAA